MFCVLENSHVCALPLPEAGQSATSSTNSNSVRAGSAVGASCSQQTGTKAFASCNIHGTGEHDDHDKNISKKNNSTNILPA